MSIRHYEQPRYQRLPLIRAMFAANLLFAVAVLVAWQGAMIYFFGPLNWALDRSVNFDHDWGHIFEYPLLALWAGPAVAMALAWILMQARNYRLAFGVLLTPLGITLLSLAMYWVVPGTGQ